MQLKLVPIPFDNLADTVPHWFPFIDRLQLRSGENYLDKIKSGETLLFIAWDDDGKRAVALAGARFILRHGGRTAEILWICTDNLRESVVLLPVLERYLCEQQGCGHVRAVMRKGLVRIMKRHGYKVWHVVMEKEL